MVLYTIFGSTGLLVTLPLGTSFFPILSYTWKTHGSIDGSQRAVGFG